MAQPDKRGQKFDDEFIRTVGDALGIDWDEVDFGEFRDGFLVELEHGTVSPETNITDDDPEMTALIALAHLNELDDYYTRLGKMEQD